MSKTVSENPKKDERRRDDKKPSDRHRKRSRSRSKDRHPRHRYSSSKKADHRNGHSSSDKKPKSHKSPNRSKNDEKSQKRVRNDEKYPKRARNDQKGSRNDEKSPIRSRKRSRNYEKSPIRSRNDEKSRKSSKKEMILPRRSSLWDRTPTEAQTKSTSLNQGLVVKMPDGTFASAPTVMGTNSLNIGIQDKISPGTLKTSTDLLNRVKQARRILIGNVPPDVDKETLINLLNTQINSELKSEGNNVVSIIMNKLYKTVYIELKSEQAANSAIKLTETELNGYNITVQRLTTATIASCTLSVVSGGDIGLTAAVSNTATTVVGNTAVSRFVEDGPGKIFLAGIPPDLGQTEVLELVSVYGELESFFLPQDPQTNKSRGYAFFRYQDVSITSEAIKGLHGIQIGDAVLTAKPHSVQAKTDPTQHLRRAQEVLLATAGSDRSSKRTRVLCLLHMVTPENLANDEEYKEICDDIKEECGNYGTVVEVKVPRPSDDEKAGIGKVFVKFRTDHESMSAKGSLEGRTFERRTVFVRYFDEAKFDEGKLGKNLFDDENGKADETIN